MSIVDRKIKLRIHSKVIIYYFTYCIKIPFSHFFVLDTLRYLSCNLVEWRESLPSGILCVFLMMVVSPNSPVRFMVHLCSQRNCTVHLQIPVVSSRCYLGDRLVMMLCVFPPFFGCYCTIICYFARQH